VIIFYIFRLKMTLKEQNKQEMNG